MLKKNTTIEKRIKILINVFILIILTLNILLIVQAVLAKQSVFISSVIATIFMIITIIMLIIYKYKIYDRYKQSKQAIKNFNDNLIVEEVLNLDYPVSDESQMMINKLVGLVNSQEAIRQSNNQAEYQMLQSQINPHFLYNTLEGIRGEAVIKGVESIAEMTEALSTFFRYNIQNTSDLVMLEDELENAKNYFFIQQFRFNNRLDLKIIKEDDDENTVHYKIPNLTLQPIIENSIYHGLERKIGKGEIKIVITTTKKKLIINVIDDGIGISQEKVNKINEKLAKAHLTNEKNKTNRGGLALVNVNKRIRLLFGENYGIYISSAENVGTDVEIVLPKKAD